MPNIVMRWVYMKLAEVSKDDHKKNSRI